MNVTQIAASIIAVLTASDRRSTVTSGSNRLVTRRELAAAVLKACQDGPYTGELPPLWDGQAGPRIARIITAWLAAEENR